MKYERHCIICGEAYSYCNNCSDYDHLPRWMFTFHDENCRNIWRAINSYRTGVKDATQTRDTLDKLDLSKKDKFDPVFKGYIDEIYKKADPKPVVKKEETFVKKDYKKNR